MKVYPDGITSGYLHDLNVGDSIEVKGPFVKLKYQRNMKKSIGMVAGGTGITPMLQVIQQVLTDPEDSTKMTLIFANQTEDDILLKVRKKTNGHYVKRQMVVMFVCIYICMYM